MLSQASETFTATADDLGQVAESDESNNTAQDIVTAAAPQPVVARAGGPYAGTLGQPIAFSASGSSGPITNYLWTFGDGSSGQGVTMTHVYNAPGTYTATLTVMGSGGQQAADSAQVTVATAPQPVVARAGGPYAGTLGQTIAFSASGSSGPITNYLWTFGDGSSGQGVTMTHVYNAPGTYTATLTVVGSGGQQAADSAQVTVATAPQPVVARAGGPYAGTLGQPIAFNASGSSGPITNYLWTFGDGSSGQGVTTTHVYNAPGTYTATLTVMGSGGQQAADSAQVSVNPSVPPLSVDLSLPKGTYQVGESIVIGYTVNRDAYVYICNVDPTGAVVLVFPNYREPNARVSAGAHSVPGAPYTLTVSGATGGEALYAFAATSPLPNFPTSFGTSFSDPLQQRRGVPDRCAADDAGAASGR